MKPPNERKRMLGGTTAGERPAQDVNIAYEVVTEATQGENGAFDQRIAWLTDGRDGWIVQHSHAVTFSTPDGGEQKCDVVDFYEAWYVTKGGHVSPRLALEDGSVYH